MSSCHILHFNLCVCFQLYLTRITKKIHILFLFFFFLEIYSFSVEQKSTRNIIPSNFNCMALIIRL